MNEQISGKTLQTPQSVIHCTKTDKLSVSSVPGILIDGDAPANKTDKNSSLDRLTIHGGWAYGHMGIHSTFLSTDKQP